MSPARVEPVIRNTRDASGRPPELHCYLNLGTLSDLPEWSDGPRGDERAVLEAVRWAGFVGVQGGDPGLARSLGLGYADGGRINRPGEADGLARVWKERGAVCGTAHVAWGLEEDAEVDRLVDAVAEASLRHDLPIYIETHRATVTDDLWRTVKLVERRSGLRFNGDFSHWYTGHEMVYGGFEAKADFIAPVLERVRFLHGRIGNPGSMQVDVGATIEEARQRPYVRHFMELWTRAMVGFLGTAAPGDFLCFAPELLQPSIYYARTFPDTGGRPREEGDRWRQALLYARIAGECWSEAQRRRAAMG